MASCEVLQPQPDGQAALLAGLLFSATQEKFTDLVVCCGERSWKLHRLVVCARSDFFAKACEGEFKEAKERVIQLHDDDPNVLHQMFGYMYNAAYDDTAADMPPVLLNVRMIAIAEKYFVSHLATLAIDKLSHAADAAWETEAFADAICEAWATGANREVESRLRKTLLDVVVQHGKDPFDTEQSKYAYFQATAAETTGISKEVASVVTKELAKLREEMANPPRLRTYKCPGSESHGCRAAFRTLMEAGQGASYDCDMCGYGWTQDYEDWQEFRIIMQEVQTCKHSSDVG